MKTRIGFVSNSSTTSFCIYGGVINSPDEISLDGVKKIREIIPDVFEKAVHNFEMLPGTAKYGKFMRELDSLSESEQRELRHAMFDHYGVLGVLTDLGAVKNCTENKVYIGEMWRNIGLDETGRQFMARIKSSLANVFIDEPECMTIEEAWS